MQIIIHDTALVIPCWSSRSLQVLSRLSPQDWLQAAVVPKCVPEQSMFHIPTFVNVYFSAVLSAIYAPFLSPWSRMFVGSATESIAGCLSPETADPTVFSSLPDLVTYTDWVPAPTDVRFKRRQRQTFQADCAATLEHVKLSPLNCYGGMTSRNRMPALWCNRQECNAPNGSKAFVS